VVQNPFPCSNSSSSLFQFFFFFIDSIHPSERALYSHKPTCPFLAVSLSSIRAFLDGDGIERCAARCIDPRCWTHPWIDSFSCMHECMRRQRWIDASSYIYTYWDRVVAYGLQCIDRSINRSILIDRCVDECTVKPTLSLRAFSRKVWGHGECELMNALHLHA
jgi:hypothetical protein